jgi:hypothetical protein
MSQMHSGKDAAMQLLAGLLLLGGGIVNAQNPPATPAVGTQPTAVPSAVAPMVPSAEQCLAATVPASNLEYCKLRLEQQKYRLERVKQDSDKFTPAATALAVLVSALVGFGTIIFNLISANRQARLQVQLKALEVVMGASGPNSGRERLKVVKKLLGEKLTAGIDENVVIEGVGTGHDESRRTLLKLLAEHPDRRVEILAEWEVVFEKAKLVDHIRLLQQHVGSNQPAASVNQL